jgi:NodT family efflux transporter outer membrane factor (OMF) lipoprotein
MTFRVKSNVIGLMALAASMLLISCAVGPNFRKPAPPEGAGYSKKPLRNPQAPNDVRGGGAQHFVSGKDINFDWWKSFECPSLNALVESSINTNPTIDAARAALRQAEELTRAQEGYFFPTIGANYNLERQQLAGNLGGNSPGIQGNGHVIATFSNPAGPVFNGPVTFNMHTAQLTIGYTLDVFGGNRRQVESLDAQAKMQAFELEAAYITLSSNVVAAAIQEASLRGQVAATQELIEVNKKMVEMLRKQVATGYANGLDLAAQEAQLAQVVATLPPLLKQLAQQRDLLSALAGRLPSQEPGETFELASLHLPRDLPLSLPSNIIEQRPDVRAAEENVRSASAQVGVAIANRLPQFTITGAAGGVASKFTQMFSTGGPFWSLTGDVVQPIFDGNTLLHRKRAADQALIQAAAQYKSTVITAYQNVADTLHALEQDGDALKTAHEAEHDAKVTLDLTTHQFQIGYVNYLGLLSAEQSYQQALINLVQAQTNRYADTTALFQALGGGWWNRQDVTQTR